MTAFSFFSVLIAAIVILVIAGVIISFYLLLKHYQKRQYETVLKQRNREGEKDDRDTD